MCSTGGSLRCCSDGGGVQFLKFGFVGGSVPASLWLVLYDPIKEGQLSNVAVHIYM